MKLLVVNINRILAKSIVHRKIFQQTIALRQHLVVFNERVQIIGVALRNHAVNKLSAGFASFNNQIPICRRNDYQRQKPDVFAEFFVSFSISFYYFFLPFFCAHNNFFSSIFSFVKTFHHKKFGIVFYILGGYWVKITFSEGKMVNGIEHIGFSNAVVSHKTIYLWVEFEGFSFKVFIVE